MCFLTLGPLMRLNRTCIRILTLAAGNIDTSYHSIISIWISLGNGHSSEWLNNSGIELLLYIKGKLFPCLSVNFLLFCIQVV